jgi:hypothetical protein
VENLREILGDELPESEIKSIIEESDITRDGRVAYFEFLALFKDQNEDMMGVPLDVSVHIGNSHISAAQQNIPFIEDEDDSIDTTDVVARENFVEGKQLSERKVEAAAKVQSNPFTDDQNDEKVATV